MRTHLKDQQFYKDNYDRHTVEWARRGMTHYDKFYADFESKLPKGEKIDRPGNAFLINVFYMETVGNDLLKRYEEREQSINEWIARDQAKDDQVANARFTDEPTCHHCGKQGLRITDKSLMHRGEDYKYDDPEEVLFVLHCSRCDKNSAFWEDGTAWKVKPIVCLKCESEVTYKTTKTKKAITITYTCTSCKHIFKDKMDLSSKEEKPDPHFDKDREHFCLHDKEFRDRLFKMRHDFIEMARLGKEFKEREDNKHVYDAVKEMKKPKIAELAPLLAPVLEKAGYIEFHLDKPEMGRDVYVGFSCLDSKSDREDSNSRKILNKLVDNTLSDTNWRLMSSGISYRLGYLNGRVRAYEGEETMKELIIKDGKIKRKPESTDLDKKNNRRTLKGEDGRDIIL